jgi:DNA-binding transcriptional MerR regulator
MVTVTAPDHQGSALRSSQVADAAGVNVQTLRYYERRGLLPQPGRTLGGHRLYPPETVALLRTIKTAQRLGFTLDETSELLRAGRHVEGHRHGRGVHGLAAIKLAEVEAKIADLAVIRDVLRRAIDAGCEDLSACAQSDECPLPFAEGLATR